MGTAVLVCLGCGAAAAQWWTDHSVANAITDHRFVYPEQEFDNEQIDWVAYQEESRLASQGGAHYEALEAFVKIPGFLHRN